jgi:membrane protease YdiL (CAAX protease family)
MDSTLLAGLAVAATAMGSMFAFGRRHFWSRAVAAGTVIGLFGAVAERGRLGEYLRPTVVDVVIGVSSAAVLYGVFLIGDRVVAQLMPAWHREVRDLYRLRAEARPGAIPPMIAVVATTEEVFWRGFVQARAGLLVATAAYALVLIWERKVVLIVAALICGATWGALFAWRHTLVAPVLSHVLWDLAIMAFLPVGTGRSAATEATPPP